MEYNTDFFINKFEAIPENRMCSGALMNNDKAGCARGHCLYDLLNGRFFSTVESKREDRTLCNLFGLRVILKDFDFPLVVDINNGLDPRYQQPTPKQRILAALYDIKASEAVREVQELVNQPVSNAPKQIADAIR